VKGFAAKKKQESLRNLAISIEGADENLGENFEETPWLPPQVEKAVEFRKVCVSISSDIIL
jgi:hypothetical protein